MSMDPQQMQQMLALYKAQFPGQMAMEMGNAPQGTNTSAGGMNAIAKIIMALMQAKRMKQYQQQYPQQPNFAQANPQIQGQTTSAPGGLGGDIGGMSGPP